MLYFVPLPAELFFGRNLRVPSCFVCFAWVSSTSTACWATKNQTNYMAGGILTSDKSIDRKSGFMMYQFSDLTVGTLLMTSNWWLRPAVNSERFVLVVQQIVLDRPYSSRQVMYGRWWAVRHNQLVFIESRKQLCAIALDEMQLENSTNHIQDGRIIQIVWIHQQS